MGKIIAIANQKGGVGKTTTAINLGGCLGVLEYKTLIVDADPQVNATSGVGLDPKNTKNIYDCLINDVHPSELIIPTSNPNLDIIPSHIDLVGAELEMINMKKIINSMSGELGREPPFRLDFLSDVETPA